MLDWLLWLGILFIVIAVILLILGFYWQDSMGDWKVADHYLSCPCGYFPDHMKTIGYSLPLDQLFLPGNRRKQ